MRVAFQYIHNQYIDIDKLSVAIQMPIYAYSHNDEYTFFGADDKLRILPEDNWLSKFDC